MAQALFRVRDGLDDTRRVVDALESVLGSKDVADALDDFEDHWDDGRGRIKENIEGTVDAISQSVDAYRGTDEDLAAAFDQPPGGGPEAV